MRVRRKNQKNIYFVQISYKLTIITTKHKQLIMSGLQLKDNKINTSTYRNVCRFSKAQRFANLKKTATEYNYYISSRPTSRTCNFGIGNKLKAQNRSASPAPNRYNVFCFPSDQRATSLGYSREQAVFGSLKNQVQKKAALPSPDAYNIVDVKGKSYSLGMRLPGQIQSSVKKRVPGPGQYKTLQINPQGRYSSSKNKNTPAISFGGTKPRPVTSQTARLGPGAYDLFNLDSDFSQPKVLIMRRHTARNFGTSGRSAVEDRSKLLIPGPGNYNSFSCFGGGFVPRVS